MGNALSCFKKEGPTTTTTAGGPTKNTNAGAKAKVEKAGSKVKGTAETAKEKVESAAKDAKAKAENAGHKMENKAEGMTEEVKEKTEMKKKDTGDEITPAMGDTSETMSKGNEGLAAGAAVEKGSSSSSASSSSSSVSEEMGKGKKEEAGERGLPVGAAAIPVAAAVPVAAAASGDKTRSVEVEQGDADVEPERLIRVDDGLPISGMLSPAKPPSGEVYVPPKPSMEAAPVEQFWDVEIKGLEHQMPEEERQIEVAERDAELSRDVSESRDKGEDEAVVMGTGDLGDVRDEFEDARGIEGPSSGDLVKEDRDMSAFGVAGIPTDSLTAATPVEKLDEEDSNVQNLKAKFEQAKDELPQAKALNKDIRDPVTGEMVTIEEFKRRVKTRGIVDENVKKYEGISDEAAKERAELEAQKEALEKARRESTTPAEKGLKTSPEEPLETGVVPSEEGMDPPLVGAVGSGTNPMAADEVSKSDIPREETEETRMESEAPLAPQETFTGEEAVELESQPPPTDQDVPGETLTSSDAKQPSDSTELAEDEALLMTGGTGIPPATAHPLHLSGADAERRPTSLAG